MLTFAAAAREELPYGEDCFDAVSAFNSVQYATDPVQGLREIKRVAKPGASVAVAIWGDPDRCQARVLLAAIGALLPPPPPGAAGPFALAVPGALETLVETAHLKTLALIDSSGGWSCGPRARTVLGVSTRWRCCVFLALAAFCCRSRCGRRSSSDDQSGPCRPRGSTG